MLSDQLDGRHYGVLMLGDAPTASELNPAQRQHMFNVERANLIAARTVGSNRFMATVLQQNRGSATGEETDMGDPTTMDGEDAESERPLAADSPVGEPVGNLTQVHETLRNELNAFLAREAWADAELVQRSIVLILDSLNGANRFNVAHVSNYFNDLVTDLST